MSPATFRKALVEKGERYVLETIILAAKPILFAARQDYELWRDEVSRAIEIRSNQVKLVGSAVTGFSLAPAKYGRVFAAESSENRRASDLDLVVIDSPLFHECWAATVRQDRLSRLNIFGDEKEKLKQDIYYGFVADNVTPKSSKAFQHIIALRSACGRHPASGGIKVNMRIYHREEDFNGYQIASLRSLKRSFTPTML